MPIEPPGTAVPPPAATQPVAPPPAARTRKPRSTDRRTAALTVLCFVQFMLVLDDTVVSVALPSIRSDLGFGTAGLAWVVNAYFLSFGGLLLLGGRMADLLGRRRVFQWGVALFGAASLLCAVAQEPWQLVTGRFIQGAGAAIASPAALSLISCLFPAPEERGRALGVWGGIAGLGGTMGLVVSGALTDLASWRWIFLINLPVAAVALLLMPRLVEESRAPEAGRRLDVPGAILGTGAVAALVYGLLQTAESGWGHADSTVPLILAAVLGSAFVAVESRTAQPLVPAAFLAVRTLLVANVATLLVSAALYAMAFLLMLHLQTVLHYEPLTAGLAYLPYGAGILAGVWLSSRVVAAIGLRWALTTSLLITAAGNVVLAGIEPGDGYAAGVLPGLLITSLGCGLALPALATAALTDTDEHDAGLGSAIFTSMQQVGGAVGLATLVALAASQTNPTNPEQAATDGFATALLVAAALTAAAAALTAALRPRSTN
ncbi:MFS transporter [Yinghuangia sp. YIM S09857]|uniref:MFS transporter n=1 Tax=Yinghuangia sp. YIM S09857 TaxID=3436929 RepID=UPI003F52E767